MCTDNPVLVNFSLVHKILLTPWRPEQMPTPTADYISKHIILKANTTTG